MTHPETEADIRWAVGNAKRLQRENERLRAALQRIKDNGERGGYAYGVAFAALANEQQTATTPEK